MWNYSGSSINVTNLVKLNMSLGDRLKQARLARQMTQPELANRSGVPQGTISKIERTKQESSSFTVQLATALECNPVWLSSGGGDSWLYGVREPHGSYITTHGTDVTDLLEKMTPETRRLWVRIGKAMLDEKNNN